ncbi:hypothetical protein Droror1_Dr00001720 [Drosera rotundifolia]
MIKFKPQHFIINDQELFIIHNQFKPEHWRWPSNAYNKDGFGSNPFIKKRPALSSYTATTLTHAPANFAPVNNRTKREGICVRRRKVEQQWHISISDHIHQYLTEEEYMKQYESVHETETSLLFSMQQLSEFGVRFSFKTAHRTRHMYDKRVESSSVPS